MKHQSKIAVIGGSNMDIMGVSSTQLTNADSYEGKVKMSAGGVARNIAENLARLNLNVSLCSVMGADDHGEALWRHNEEVGIDMSTSAYLPDERTSVYLTVHNLSGELSIAINDMAIMPALTPEFLMRQQHKLNAANIWVIDTNLSESSIDYLFRQYGDRAVFVDTVSGIKAKRVKKHLNAIHTIKPNRLEAQTLTGMSCDTRREVETCAQALLDKGVQQVVITLDEAGLYYASSTEQGAMDAQSCRVVNTSGAGDALTSGLVYAHAQGASLHDACQFAQACAALTVGVIPTNNPALSISAIHDLLSS
ncbi:carbohydrate kinase [Formosimonas limnophila]|uniref:Carbohydrate kinase n=1 Tax=Formosimonas limnophila TaxID=1384487 RepID=A0A8J3CLF2_9BURK|nr:PfkB family carbohydrate kinase [Formosimonas limnophila]GHA76070.1 carbohydrate kinase [Formosimonas limnophila]